mmetsp:Transcript_17687/g.26693  ORF Transcript_17687/g.26693 Transcript_17687/m.26693 type:complete len:84 (+) Transcript_17687:214-465(+)
MLFDCQPSFVRNYKYGPEKPWQQLSWFHQTPTANNPVTAVEKWEEEKNGVCYYPKSEHFFFNYCTAIVDNARVHGRLEQISHD